MQTNNHLSGVNLSDSYCQSHIQNTSTSFYAVVYFRAHRVSLGFFCDSTSKEIKKTYLSVNAIFFIPENEISKIVKVFLVSISIHKYFFLTKN